MIDEKELSDRQKNYEEELEAARLRRCGGGPTLGRNPTSFLAVKKFYEPDEHWQICGTDLFCSSEPRLAGVVRCMAAAH